MYLGQSLTAMAETINLLDRTAVAILLYGDTVWYFPKMKRGQYAKTVSFFPQADDRNYCTVVVTGQAVYLCDKRGMQVPCNLCFSGTCPFLETLQRELETMEL